MSERVGGGSFDRWDGDEAARGPAEPSGYGYYQATPPPPPPPVPPQAPPGFGAAGLPPVTSGLEPASDGPMFDLTPVTILAGPGGEPRGRRRPRTAVVATAVAVVALLLAGVGVRQLVTVAHAAAAPASQAPASTFAYAQVHLNPSTEQKLALLQFASKIPGSPITGASSANNVVADLLQAALQDSPIDYTADIMPWLGDYAAVAAFPGPSGRPEFVGILAVRDAGKAGVSLGRLGAMTHVAYAVHDGYAVLAQTAQALADARQGARLTTDTEFTGDVASMTGDPLVLGWVDAHRLLALVPNLAQLGPAAATLPKQLGRIVVGATVQASYADVQLRVRGSSQVTPHLGPVGGMITALPNDTSVAIAVGTPAVELRQWTQTLDRLSSGLGGMSTLPGLGGLGSLTGAGPADAAGTEQAAFTGGGPGTYAGALSTEIKRATGLNFPGDFATLLGNTAVFAMSRVDRADPGRSDMGLRTHPADLAKAEALGEVLGRHIDPQGSAVNVRSAGKDLVIASPLWYADELSDGGHLGDTQLFRTAMGDNVSSAATAVFLNLKGVDAHAPISAVGATVRYDGGDGVVDFRVVP